MGQLTTTAVNELMDHCFENGAYTPSTTMQVSLWVGDPTISGAGGAEAAYTNYTRQTIAFDNSTARLLNQTSQVNFPQCGASPQAGITHYGIHDTTGGVMRAFGSLSSTVNVVTGNTPSIAAGQIDISFGSNNMSTYLANKLLNFMFRNVAFTAPALWIALTTATCSVTDTTLSGKEVANSANYSRLDFADWTTSSGGALSNATDATFATPSGSWGTAVACALMDGGTHSAGNMLWFDNGITDQAIGNGDTVKFSAGDFDVTLA